MLEGPGAVPRLVGLDASPAMLRVAREKMPATEFVLGDMADVERHATFDVVACVVDTLNHLATLERWRSLAARPVTCGPGGCRSLI